MRAVVQRVHRAHVVVDDQIVGQIAEGLLIYLGVAQDDQSRDAQMMANKVAQLRIFEDVDGKMNLDAKAIGGSALVVSAFTTLGDARKGNRPSFGGAAAPELAERLYDEFTDLLSRTGIVVATGRFRAHMEVMSENDGPICLIIDSKKQDSH